MALPEAPEKSYLDELVAEWFLKNRFERFGAARFERVVNSARHEFEKRLFETICTSLDKRTLVRLRNLLKDKKDKDGTTGFTKLRADMGAASLKNVLQAIDRLETLRAIYIPDGILHGINPKHIKCYRQRAGTENAWELRRHPPQICFPLLVFYCVPREGEIFAVASEDTIADLVKEHHANGPAYAKKIYTKIRSAYAQHYRQMMPRILDSLDFRSNNAAWRPILDAIDVLKENQDSRKLYFSINEVPVDGVVRSKWRDIVVEKAPDGTEQINRINYEICVLHALRNKLRCKEIWRSRMTDCDMAALTPLPYGHLNPYGFFDLNMKERLPIDALPVAA